MKMKANKEKQIILEKIFQDAEPELEEMREIFPQLFSTETLKQLEKKGKILSSILLI
jgi:hypothetical protein